MEKIYTERLLRFADHIGSITNHPEEGLFRIVIIRAIEDNYRIAMKVRTPYWVFEELVMFDEWYYDPTSGDPRLEGLEPSAGTGAGVCEFFGLGADEFCHLFDCEKGKYQDIGRFGGQLLTENSDGLAIAKNIIELVKRNK